MNADKEEIYGVCNYVDAKLHFKTKENLFCRQN